MDTSPTIRDATERRPSGVAGERPTATPVFIVAEAGVNHGGRLEVALELVDAAADAGTDAIIADYQKRDLGGNDTQIEMLRCLEL
jgi:hypothetical protein